MKKSVLGFCLRLAVILLFVFAFYQGYSLWLTGRINSMYPERFIAVDHASGQAEKDRGSILLENCLRNTKLLIFGSSELGSPVPENPKNLFPNNLYEGDATFAGRAFVQNASFAMLLGSNADFLDNMDIAIVESLQWFYGSGVEAGGFLSYFSELQFYEFLNNDALSKETRDYLCDRYVRIESTNEESTYLAIEQAAEHSAVWSGLYSSIFGPMRNHKISLVNGDLSYPQSYILGRLYSTDNVAGRLLYYILKPYYWMRYQVQLLKDKYDAYNWLRSLPPEQNNTVLTIDWDAVYAAAQQEGQEACTNNDLYVYDEYYSTYLSPDWELKKDKDANMVLMDSEEWNDFQFFLHVCQELGLSPYVISMSTNGLYYDYVGISREKRTEVYDKIEQMSTQSNMPCLKLDDMEYEPYFYCDVMHLGWKGWPYVIQNTIEHFSE